MRKKFWQVKIILFVITFIAIVFFSNDFGIIDIEKTAIITSVGIDRAEDEFEVTVQIALPQATATTSENNKAVVSAKGATASEAIHQIGNITGWYPRLAFCNLIILGETMLGGNVNTVLDYFSKTLKVQDSACLAACEGSAKKLLSEATPLDNISSFAIQKILLKERGMTSDVVTMDVKKFSIGYYSNDGSGFMPQVKTVPVAGEENSQKAGGGESGGSSGDTGGSQGGGNESGGSGSKNSVYDAATTLLFKNGFHVGEFDEHETKAYNLVSENVHENIFIVDNVETEGKTKNVLLTIIKNDYKLDFYMDKAMPVLKVKAKFFCRMEDCTCTDKEGSLKNNIFVPEEICKKAEDDFISYFSSIISKCRESGCDVLGLDKKLFRHYNKFYKALHGRIYENLNVIYDIDFTGAK